MTTTVKIASPADLKSVMGTPYEVSPQQWAAISAPLEPAVVIAGAGSGKTSLMAARVVYLVATGQVTPDQVLGLTFTTKAASELAHRIREALTNAGFGRMASSDASDEVLEPVVATYNAYAASLLTRARSPDRSRAGHPGDGRRLALPAGRAGHRPAHGPRSSCSPTAPSTSSTTSSGWRGR